MPDPTPSPLSEVDPNSINDLFERVNNKLVMGMPEAITDEDIMPLVNTLLSQRKTFLSEQDRLGRAPSAKKKTGPVKSVAEVIHQIDIEELE